MANLIVVICATHDSTYFTYTQMLHLAARSGIQVLIHIVSKDLQISSEIDLAADNIIVGSPKDIVQFIGDNNLGELINELYFDDADAYCHVLYMSRFIQEIMTTSGKTKIIFLSSSTAVEQEEPEVGCKVFIDRQLQNMRQYFICAVDRQLKLYVIRTVCSKLDGQVIIFCKVSLN